MNSNPHAKWSGGPTGCYRRDTFGTAGKKTAGFSTPLKSLYWRENAA
jgi:hypothetical protein